MVQSLTNSGLEIILRLCRHLSLINIRTRNSKWMVFQKEFKPSISRLQWYCVCGLSSARLYRCYVNWTVINATYRSCSGLPCRIGNGNVSNVKGIPRAEQIREWLGKLVQCLTVKVFYKALLSALLLYQEDPQAFYGTLPSRRQGRVLVWNGQGELFERLKKIYGTKRMRPGSVQCTNTALNKI
jgi:hypothetical protein